MHKNVINNILFVKKEKRNMVVVNHINNPNQ